MADRGFQGLQRNRNQVPVCQCQSFQANLDVPHNSGVDCVRSSSTGGCFAADLEGDPFGVIAVDGESLRRVVEDKPAWVIVHLRLHKNQGIGNYFDGDA
jgi:hypothetical protein